MSLHSGQVRGTIMCVDSSQDMLERRAEQIFERLVLQHSLSGPGLALTLSTAGFKFIHCQANPAMRRGTGICENGKNQPLFSKGACKLVTCLGVHKGSDPFQLKISPATTYKGRKLYLVPALLSTAAVLWPAGDKFQLPHLNPHHVS